VRVPLSWLRDLCPTGRSAEELAGLLTDHGIEVERVIRPWDELSGVMVARVLEVREHPKADRLCVVTIDDEAGQREVVVGVRNMGPGDLVPYAPPGAMLPGFEGKLERREIRGVISEGMLCSPNELGISADHSAILVLDEGAEPGAGLKETLGLDESVIDIEVHPNRPDLLSVVGVAREVAAITGEDLFLPDVSVEESPEPAAEAATVVIVDRDRCPRYLARAIRGVAIEAAPLLVQIRLTSAGMRPLSNVIDATNYVMLEVGQPLHPFDLHRLAGPGIVVRLAGQGERLTTLDGVERSMTPDDLLIADQERGVAVAGVMGGAGAEVSEGTADVLLESANFHPAGIFRTARRLGVRTEASVRFERGVDPEAVWGAATRAASLIAEWSGGTVLRGVIDVGAAPKRRRVTVRPHRASLLLGMELSSADIREALGRLRLPAFEEEDAVAVEAPSYRVDLAREVDLIEEVGRVAGYERVPSTLPGVRQAGGLSRDQRIRRRLRDVLAGAGLWEAQSSSFVPASDAGLFPGDRSRAVRLANPVAEDQAYLRTSLLPGLLRAARHNVAHRRLSVRLFEVGRVFRADQGDPVEEERVAVVLTGPAAEEWPGDRRELDFLDAKGVLEHLLSSLGVDSWSIGPGAGAPYHVARSAQILLAGEPVGELGEVDRRVAETFDVSGRVAGLELLIEPMVAAASSEVAYHPVFRFPPVHRDLAFVLDRDAPAGEVRAALIETAGELLDRAALFDVYEGDPLPAGKKSLAFSTDFRAKDRTLSDEDADAVVRRIAERLARDFGAELRAG
jgi:phenylalanyl-tRNA synthetase beta chain